MDWLRSNWLKILLVVFAVSGWVTHMEFEAKAASEHRKESCIKWCIEDCLESCKWQNIAPSDCNCNHCYQKCGN